MILKEQSTYRATDRVYLEIKKKFNKQPAERENIFLEVVSLFFPEILYLCLLLTTSSVPQEKKVWRCRRLSGFEVFQCAQVDKIDMMLEA